MGLKDGGSTAGFSTASRERAVETAPREAPPPLPALTVLAHPDLERIGERVLLGELASGRQALLSRQQPRFTAPGERRGRALDDRYLSRRPLRFTPLAHGSVALRLDGSRTAVVVDGEPLGDACAVSAERLDRGVVLELARRVVLLLHALPCPADPPPPRFGLVGDSAGIVQVRQAIARVAERDVAGLLRGETGTGKELVAAALHQCSGRRDGPFVSVNLGAVPASLAASELFGARKGAYTGAEGHDGYFVSADGGTLFLDEIGEASAEVQVLLLRVLESHEVVAVGCARPRRVDVRVISATDVDLEDRVREGKFRAPLLHRLKSYTLSMPPLRERRDDVGRLLVHFLREELREAGLPPPARDAEARAPWLPAALAARLARYDWPGNVRQLSNVARQLVIDGHGQPALGTSRLDELLPPPRACDRRAAAVDADETLPTVGEEAAAGGRRRWRKPSDVSEQELAAALREHRYELKATAAALGVSRTSLYDLVGRSPHVRAAADVPPTEIRDACARLGGDLPALVDELRLSERALRQRLKDLGLR